MAIQNQYRKIERSPGYREERADPPSANLRKARCEYVFAYLAAFRRPIALNSYFYSFMRERGLSPRAAETALGDLYGAGRINYITKTNAVCVIVAPVPAGEATTR